MIDKQYVKSDVILIVILSVYCVALVIAALGFLFYDYPNLETADGAVDDTVLLRLVVAVGVVGSVLRGASRLYDDVASGLFDPRRSLSVLMRPVEGAAISVVFFFILRTTLLVLQRGDGPINPWGFLALAAVVGMFSHGLADGLQERFGRLVTTEVTRGNGGGGTAAA